MPFDRPSLPALRERIAADLATRFPGADVGLRVNGLRALAAVIGGASYEDLAFLDWLSKQLLPDRNEVEYLERWGALKDVARKASTRSVGVVTIEGEIGATVPTGAILRRGDGVEFATEDPLVFVGTTIEAAVRAVLGGATGDADAGTQLAFVTTPPGVADTAIVTTAIGGGADTESDAALRLRILRALREPARGGNRTDWERWALAIDGVTRIWTVEATPTPGAVTLYPMLDEMRAVQNGIPQGTNATRRGGQAATGSGDQRLVLDALADSRPVCASLFVTALAPVAHNVTISGLVNDTPDLRARIALELKDMLWHRAAPGVSIVPSWTSEAISRAAGEDRHTLVSGTLTVAAGQIAVPGTLTVT